MNKASNLTIFKKSPQKFNVSLFGNIADDSGATLQATVLAYILERSFHGQQYASTLLCLKFIQLQDDNFKISVQESPSIAVGILP